jgi:sulfhydrogenase subunit beta (sulfur reductase)
MEKSLDKKQLGAWLAELSAYDLHAPELNDGVWAYQRVRDPSTVDLSHDNTVAPPKKFTLPQREVLFRFSREPGRPPKLTAAMPDGTSTVVFGVRPCDGRSRVRNDMVFAKGLPDEHYIARQKRVAYVGLACNTPPSENCFCQSLGGSPHSEEGLDVLMTELKDSYVVKPLTEQGVQLLERGEQHFAELTELERAELALVRESALAEPHRAVANLASLPAALEAGYDSPAWAELAQACISCGVCTYLCPTCHCFDITDEVTRQSPALEGERVRTWDTCQFPTFTLHASGHNPRPDVGARLRQRISHKFRYFHENHGVSQCTGCGRCITHCPVGIDILTVLERVTS